MTWDKEDFCERLKGATRKDAIAIVTSTRDDLARFNRRKKPNKGEIAKYGHITYPEGVAFLGKLLNELTTGGTTDASAEDRDLINAVIRNLA